MKHTASRQFGFLEYLLRHERFFLALVLVLVASLSWFWIAAMARDMYGSMDGFAAWMMTPNWDAPHLVLLWAMWAVMMVAMMLPSAAPTLLLYLRAARVQEQAGARVYALAAGYLSVWTIFSVGATLLQRLLAATGILSPMMGLVSPIAISALLIAAGLYQLTPLKRVCLRSCRSPLSFLMRRWQPGWAGAYRMGLEHGAYCLGCCWALMLLLFAGGIMNLAVIIALSVWVLVEKLLPLGEYGARAMGLALIAAAAWILVQHRL